MMFKRNYEDTPKSGPEEFLIGWSGLSERRVATPRSSSRSRRPESGFAMATVMLVAALMLIAIAAALPDLKTQAKREKELELQFRAMQYVRAIQAYNRKFPNQWPTSIDALMNTNNVRFLRKKWKDPMTSEGEWRFIHLAPNGAVIDSTVSFQTPAVPSATGTSRAAGAGTTPSGSTGPSGFSLSSGTTSATSPSQFSATQLANLPIVGVASKSDGQSIMTCSGYDHYKDWEYIALPQGRYAGTGCYDGVPIAMLSPVGAVPGQGFPTGTPAGQGGLGTTPAGTSPGGMTQPTTPFGTLTPR